MKLLRCSKSSERCFLFKSFLEMEIDKLHRSSEKSPASPEGGPGPFYPRGGSGGGPIVH